MEPLNKIELYSDLYLKKYFHTEDSCSYFKWCKNNFCTIQSKRVIAYVNEECIYNCPYCTRFIKFKSEIDYENLKKNFQYLKKFSNISFTGGEITLLKDEDYKNILQMMYDFNIAFKSIILSANENIFVPDNIKLRFHHRKFEEMSDKIKNRERIDHVIVSYPKELEQILSYIQKYKEIKFTCFFDRMSTHWEKNEIECFKEIIEEKNVSIPLKYYIKDCLYKENFNDYISQIKYIIMQRCCAQNSINLYKAK